MPISFPCPACSKRIRISRNHAGKTGRCPKCRQALQVPTASQLADLALGTIDVTESTEDTQPTESGEVFNTLVDEETDSPAAELELERQRLALERERLELERQRLELENAQAKQSLGRRSSARLRVTSKRLPSGDTEAGEPGERRRASQRLAAKRKGASPVLVGATVFTALAAGLAVGGYVLSTQGRPAPGLGSAPEDEDSPEFAALIDKAEGGDAEAMLLLGGFYWEGVGGARNAEKAKRWLLKAAEDGDATINAKAVVALEQIRQAEALRERARELEREAEARRARDAEEQRLRAARLEAEARERDIARRAQLARDRARKEAAQKEETAERTARIREGASKTLDEAGSLVSGGSPDQLAAAINLMNDLEQRFDLDATSRSEVDALRDRVFSRARALIGEVEAAAKTAFEAGEFKQANDRIESIAQLIDPLPASLQTLWDQVGEKLAEIERAEQARHAEEVEKHKAEYAAAKERREKAREDLALLAKAQTERWIAARSASELLCGKCDGKVTSRCGSCDGRGWKEYFNGAKKCDKCAGQGEVECTRCGKETRGYSSTGLRSAFWLFLSPTARAATSSRAVIEGVVAGTVLSHALENGRLVVASGKVEQVAVLDDRVRVTVDLDYAGEGWRPERSFVVEWIREDGKLYLLSDGDKSPEALLPELPDPPQANHAFGDTQSVSQTEEDLRDLYGQRDAMTQLAWEREYAAFSERIRRTDVLDTGVIEEVRGNSGEARISVSVGPHVVLLSVRGRSEEFLAGLNKGDVLRFRGRLSRWSDSGYGQEDWRLELQDARILE